MTSDDTGSGTRNGTRIRALLSGRPRWVYAATAALGLTGIGALGYTELENSHAQSWFFNKVAKGELSTTRVCDTAPPARGPFDKRYGYDVFDIFAKRLVTQGYTASDPLCWDDRTIAGVQLTPIYNRKAQAGLHITDQSGRMAYDAKFPRIILPDFSSIPPILVDSLLYVENRALGKPHPDTWNAAVDWPRTARAGAGYVGKQFGLNTDEGGGSNLAIQIEKFWHSPNGETATPQEKFQQAMSASVRYYTNPDIQKIILDYLNSMPLSAFRGYGEIHGYSEGMAIWFGTDSAYASKILSMDDNTLSDEQMREKARIYRQSLSLIMAVKKPSPYLRTDRAGLEQRVDSYLSIMAKNGIISKRLGAAALAQRTDFPDTPSSTIPGELPHQKFIDLMRIQLLRMLKLSGGNYTLDRMDIAATTTQDVAVSQGVTNALESLTVPENAEKEGLVGFRMLNRDMVGSVVYSYALYEKTPQGNVLRVQVDNHDKAFSLNDGSKMELGSTAKLRTLISYLEVIADLFTRYAGKDIETLQSVTPNKNDALTAWALVYLTTPDTDKTLNGMLEASLDRTYSAHPGERFFTGGGVHTFVNFEPRDNGGSFTVRDSFHNSRNLPFVRMMRDIVNYTIAQKIGIDDSIIEDLSHPLREAYLYQFSDLEGMLFTSQLWNKIRGKTSDETLSLLAAETRRLPMPLAVLFRSVKPNASYEEMESFIRRECTDCTDGRDFHDLYEKYAADKFNLNDRGYLTRIDPLHLWLAATRETRPNITWDEVVRESAAIRQETYKWLRHPNKTKAQNIRIRTMLERQAFQIISQSWQEKGHPFKVSSLSAAPSYAWALGAAADTPAALAELAGILQNDGIRKPTYAFSDITLGGDTPYARTFDIASAPGKRVMQPEIARVVRREMQGVVELGTGRRVHNSIVLSDGRSLPIGAKTGTGDNRLKTFSSGGAITASSARNRTATLVFIIDDRFYGCITAYVEGPDSALHKFTSGMTSQLFKVLAPTIMPVIERAYGTTPHAPAVPAESVENYVLKADGEQDNTPEKPVAFTLPKIAPL